MVKRFQYLELLLLHLSHTLKGEAKLESIVPDELNLHIYAISSRGYLAVAGHTGYELKRTESAFGIQSFGFVFEPQQLSKVLSLIWLQEA